MVAYDYEVALEPVLLQCFLVIVLLGLNFSCHGVADAIEFGDVKAAWSHPYKLRLPCNKSYRSVRRSRVSPSKNFAFSQKMELAWRVWDVLRVVFWVPY